MCNWDHNPRILLITGDGAHFLNGQQNMELEKMMFRFHFWLMMTSGSICVCEVLWEKIHHFLNPPQTERGN